MKRSGNLKEKWGECAGDRETDTPSPNSISDGTRTHQIQKGRKQIETLPTGEKELSLKEKTKKTMKMIGSDNIKRVGAAREERGYPAETN